MSDAHAKAVEAAYRAACTAYVRAHDDGVPLRAAITAYLAAMRAEGWVMVRDVGVCSEDLLAHGALYEEGYHAGHNDCRAAMLKGAGDGQG